MAAAISGLLAASREEAKGLGGERGSCVRAQHFGGLCPLLHDYEAARRRRGTLNFALQVKAAFFAASPEETTSDVGGFVARRS